MTHERQRPDHDALAASLRTWALGFVAWVLEALGAHALTRSMRGWLCLQLNRAEKGAAALIAVFAIRLLPAPPVRRRGGARPLAAPNGFARVHIHRHDMRGVMRRLFPRERDLARRCARLLRALNAMKACARMLAPRIERILPATRLALVRPPALRFQSCDFAREPAAPDTS